MPYTDEHDASKQKTERRRTVYKLIRRTRATNLLATNYPGPNGRKFVKTKLVKALGIKVTLCEKKNFCRAASDLDGLVTKVPYTDIFFQMLSNQYDFLDLDLCGGFSAPALKSIESCTSWKTIVLTCTDKYRSKFHIPPAKPANIHLQHFIFDWCKSHEWECQLSFSPMPYQRPNKNASKGLADARGPWYYTFVITR